jgi:hypothetical protein
MSRVLFVHGERATVGERRFDLMRSETASDVARAAQHRMLWPQVRAVNKRCATQGRDK